MTTTSKQPSEGSKTAILERAVGRRKTAAARVRILEGKGVFTVNGKPYEQYFRTALLQQTVTSPLRVVGRENELSVSVRVVGGGMRGQAEAVRHGLSRALISLNADLRPLLKSEGFLTRDPRAKERKKFGRYKARRGHQWRKR